MFLKINITNPNAGSLTGVGVVDTFPSGLVGVNVLPVSGGMGCQNAAVSSTQLQLSGSTLNSGESCIYIATLNGTTLGVTNSIPLSENKDLNSSIKPNMGGQVTKTLIWYSEFYKTCL